MAVASTAPAMVRVSSTAVPPRPALVRGVNVRVSSERGAGGWWRGGVVRVFRQTAGARRQLDDEPRAARVGALYPGAATVARREVAHDGEADSRSHGTLTLAR